MTDWVTPRTWSSPELVTESLLNTHLRDQLVHLKERSEMIYFDSAPHSNSGTGETDLGTYSLPASTLGTDGQILLVGAFGTFANTANTKTWRFKFGATSVTLAAIATAGVDAWQMRAEIMRVTSTTQKIIVRISCGVGTGTDRLFYTTAAETLSSAITVRVTGQSSVASNDITEEAFYIKRD